MKIKVLLLDLLLLNMKNFDKKILKILMCPKTGMSLSYDKKRNIFHTRDLKNIYKVTGNIPNLKVK